MEPTINQVMPVDTNPERPRVKVGPRQESQGKAEIRLQKNGDVVETITVVCACGEEIKIQCVYPDKD